jgi:hypothetical protein
MLESSGAFFNSFKELKHHFDYLQAKILYRDPDSEFEGE